MNPFGIIYKATGPERDVLIHRNKAAENVAAAAFSTDIFKNSPEGPVKAATHNNSVQGFMFRFPPPLLCPE
jgi:hypothetical protein